MIIQQALEYARMGIVPVGSLRNKKYRESQVEGIEGVDYVNQIIHDGFSIHL